MKIIAEIFDRLTAILDKVKEIEKSVELNDDKIKSQISKLEELVESISKQNEDRIISIGNDVTESLKSENVDTHERLVHIEDKINKLILFQQQQMEEDISYQKETLSFNKNAKVESVDVHERLVHIEDKINLILDNKVVQNNSENIKSNYVNSKRVIHFVRNIDWKNTGDMSCDPLMYFSFFAQKDICMYHTMREIRWDLIKKNDWIILGGGGIFECLDEFQEVINRLLSVSNHVISWACGYNTHYDRKMCVQIDYSHFFRCTIRDYIVGKEEYLPDVSCMSRLFDKHYDNKRKIGILEHFEFPIIEFDYDRLSNTYAMDSIIKFIGESEVIITNTWHGCYWALLMGKKVIVYHPFSNKFENYKYQPRIYSGNIQKDIEQAEAYNNVLEECRNMNIKFAEEILKEINAVTENIS